MEKGLLPTATNFKRCKQAKQQIKSAALVPLPGCQEDPETEK